MFIGELDTVQGKNPFLYSCAACVPKEAKRRCDLLTRTADEYGPTNMSGTCFVPCLYTVALLHVLHDRIFISKY